MDINKGMIDLRLEKVENEIREQAKEELNIADPERLRSLAFVYFCVRTFLDLSPEEAFDCLTEGAQDFGVDAIYILDTNDGDFQVTLFQGKYKRNLEKESAFEEGAIRQLIHAVQHLFNPASRLEFLNTRLLAKVEDIRSRMSENAFPRVHVVACNNGIKWSEAAQELINAAAFDDDQVIWDYVNHSRLINLLQTPKSINTTLLLSGEIAVEDLNFSRVCIGRITLDKIADLMDQYGDKLLERNVRRYLGLKDNSVNQSIRRSIEESPENFYFLNNGLTLVCEDLVYNSIQKSDYSIRLTGVQIVNGGQTCMTIFKAMQENPTLRENMTNSSVLVRIYKLPKENQDIVLEKITAATNSQSPVDLKDLRSNDKIQTALETSAGELGYSYRRKRSDLAQRDEMTPGVAAEAILAVWREQPQRAKFFSREHFGKLYDEIFKPDLNGAQMIAAVLLYRFAENRRRRPAENDPFFVRYASCFIAMQMGRYLLSELSLTKYQEIDHRNFRTAEVAIKNNGSTYFEHAVQDIDRSIKELYGEQDMSKKLQQLSATFRRADLIDALKKTPTIIESTP
jgi:hypothetical protein